MRGQVAVLRNQGPQDRHQLRRTDVLYLDNLGNDVVGEGAFCTKYSRVLACTRVGEDLGDIAGIYRNIAVDLQDRQKCLIECLGGHWRRGQHRYVAADARINDEVSSGNLTHGLDNLPNVGVLVIRRDRNFLCLPVCRECQEQNHRQGYTKSVVRMRIGHVFRFLHLFSSRFSWLVLSTRTCGWPLRSTVTDTCSALPRF